jgi:S1-C subfamily serine protease
LVLDNGFSRPKPPLLWIVLFLLLALVSGAVSGVVVSLLLNDDDDAPASSAPSQSVAEAVAIALPSVVTVINEIAPSPRLPNGGIGGGAGVVIDQRGLILTNEHIVGLPGKLSVILNDGEIRPATLVSDDAPFTDLAVIRIASGGLKALPLGDSDKLQPGETLIAIGSPDVDYHNSVSVGVASGLHRRKRLGDVWYSDLIQTDAAINVGNSGGPLINLAGEVVGLNTFRDIGTDDPLFGISFAQSSNAIKPIVQSITQKGSYPRPYLGIEHRELDSDQEVSNPGQLPYGAVVTSVIQPSPASKAGIRTGDVLLTLGRIQIGPENTFINALAGAGGNNRVPVQLWREGRIVETVVEMELR